MSSLPPALRNGNESYVVSRYIDNPLLVGGGSRMEGPCVCISS